MCEDCVGELLDMDAHLIGVRTDGGIDMAADCLHDVSSGEGRPLDAQLVHDGVDHVRGCEGRTEALRTDGRLDDFGGFPTGVPSLCRPQVATVPSPYVFT